MKKAEVLSNIFKVHKNIQIEPFEEIIQDILKRSPVVDSNVKANVKFVNRKIIL